MRKILRVCFVGGWAFVVKLAACSRGGRRIIDLMLDTVMQRTQTVMHDGVKLIFAVPNDMALARADSFSTKEPETLEWIDSMEQGAIVWDIGANVGLYSCYAAKHRACNVYAFEPSVFNLELLARNIFLNGLTDRVAIIPLPLSDHLATTTLNMSMTDWGGSMSTFGESYTHDGTPINKVFEFRTVGIPMDEAISHLGIPQPHYIKMDVDGIEHLILKGGMAVLAKVRGVLVEVNEQFDMQTTDSFKYLSDAGLELVAKRHAEMFEDTVVFNQIWRRRALA